jgi:methylmalonyl-CoA/ethylmalonyl-CoA epimerase
MPEDRPAEAAVQHLPTDVAALVQGAKLDHVAVAVRDIATGARLFRDVLGGGFLFGGDVEQQAFRFAQYRFPGGGKVELVTPLGEGFVSRFLERRGEGVHHITLKVMALEEQVSRLEAAGVPLTLVNYSNPNWKEAFIHPKEANGVLIQLAESPFEDDQLAEHMRERFSEAVLLGEGTGSHGEPAAQATP